MPAAKPVNSFLRLALLAACCGVRDLDGFERLRFVQFLGISVSHDLSPVDKGSGSREPAAEGADQLYVEGEGAGLELRDVRGAPGRRLPRRSAHRDRWRARARSAAGRGGAPLRSRPARCAIPPAAETSIFWLVTASAVSRSAWMTVAVVQGDGLVILTAATAVLALERAAVEEGEAYRGADASKAGAA